MLKAVITGDLIKSRKIAAQDFDVIRYRLEQVLTYLCDKYDAEYDVYRGDSFQIIFPSMNDSITSALLIRLAFLVSSLKCDKSNYSLKHSSGVL